MIESYTFENRKYKLIDTLNDNESNIYTIVIGKNGSGKSRMLSSIVNVLIENKGGQENRLNDFQQEFDFGEITQNKMPKRVIAVSTSPFDKFPIRRFSKRLNIIYRYLGLREQLSYDYGLAFMSRIINVLINLPLHDRSQYKKLTSVLNYLGYTDNIQAKFEYRFVSKHLNRKKKFDIDDARDAINSVTPGFNRQYFFKENGDPDNEKIARLIEVINKKLLHKRTVVDLNIGLNGLEGSCLEMYSPDELTFLIDAGILRLREFYLRKLNSDRYYKLNEASSGEQCVVASLIGIACNITNNSMVFIDEPEISLHPEWQERYIKLLTNTFNDFKGCHFIIATHSPQIISKLPKENCFILNMEDCSLKNANEFINHSADFQLASLFNSPGFQNEYLTRIAFSIMAKVAKVKKFDEEDERNYSLLISQRTFLDKSDPVLQLVNLINELKQKYA